MSPTQYPYGIKTGGQLFTIYATESDVLGKAFDFPMAAGQPQFARIEDTEWQPSCDLDRLLHEFPGLLATHPGAYLDLFNAMEDAFWDVQEKWPGFTDEKSIGTVTDKLLQNHYALVGGPPCAELALGPQTFSEDELAILESFLHWLSAWFEQTCPVPAPT